MRCNEKIRCGNATLFRVDCPNCRAINLSGENIIHCVECKMKFEAKTDRVRVLINKKQRNRHQPEQTSGYGNIQDKNRKQQNRYQIDKREHKIRNNLRQNNEKITNIIDNFSAISDTVAKANLSKTLADLQTSVTGVSMAMEKINNGEGSMGLLLNDKKLYNDLESASGELNKLVTDIKLNPHRYLNFSVFPPSSKRMQYKEPQAK